MPPLAETVTRTMAEALLARQATRVHQAAAGLRASRTVARASRLGTAPLRRGEVAGSRPSPAAKLGRPWAGRRDRGGEVTVLGDGEREAGAGGQFGAARKT